MTRQTFSQIASSLSALEEKLRAEGFDKQHRFLRHMQRIHEASEAQKNGSLVEFAENLNEDERRELKWSFVEAIELAESFQFLQDQGCSFPKEVLKRALDGPVDPSSENERNNHGRNITFEIAFAGLLASAGLQPQLGSEPDVIVEFRKRRLLIACKRPLSKETVASQIELAAKQLGKRLNTQLNPAECGIIAISVTRAFTTGKQFLETASSQDVNRYLNWELEQLASDLDRKIQAVRHPKIAGVLLTMTVPGIILEDKLMITASQTLIVHINRKSDHQLLQDLANTLQRERANRF